MFSHRRSTARSTATALAALLLTAGAMSTASAAPADDTARGGKHHRVELPVGTWETYIDFGGGAIIHVTEAYTRRGELCHRASTTGYGKGTWRPTGPNTFRYQVVEKFTDAAGNYAGRAEMSGTAVQSGGVFRTDHTSSVYDAAGNFLNSDRGELVYTRTGKQNPECLATP
ncbi:hypothetical protein [Streptomyces sp. NPDC051561]|uniref:hypothetical protein n=1 Tax=Streptomyces sp. NPDC051561 TaxID=3365658 RepID=UPI00378F1151